MTAVAIIETRRFTETRHAVHKAATVWATVHAAVDVLTRHIHRASCTTTKDTDSQVKFIMHVRNNIKNSKQSFEKETTKHV